MYLQRTCRYLATSIALALASFTAAPAVLAQAPAPPAPPPATSGDGKEAKAITDLADDNNWDAAMKAAEKFLEKYKDLSPYSRNIRYVLGLAYLHQKSPMTDEAIRELKKLVPDPKAVNLKEQSMLLIAKAYAIKGAGMPDGNAVQRGPRNSAFEEAVKAYDEYLAAYPASKTNDAAYFVSGTIGLELKRYDDAVKRFGTLYQKYATSPLRGDAMLNVGKAFMLQAGDLLSPGGGKEASPEDVQKAMGIYENNALKALGAIFKETTDIALQNDAQFFIGTIRLTESQHVTETDEDKKTKIQTDYLNAALEAFRAVHSIEEVGAAIDAKMKSYDDAVGRLQPGTPEYAPYKLQYETLRGIEQDKKDQLKNGTDQYVSARINIARIFLFLKKFDESRALIRYLQGQPELMAKDKDGQAAIAALLCHTYIGQNNVDKSLETYDTFRQAFKGNEAGEDLALFVANMLVEKKAEKAEEIVNQGMDDYKDANNGAGWQFSSDAVRILIHVAMGKGDYKKALELCDKVLAGTNLKPDVEMDTLLLKGAVQEQMSLSTGQPTLQDEAFKTFQMVRDKYSSSPKAEDAWFRQTMILSGKETPPPKAQTELEAYLKAFEGGAGKSENTKGNLAIVQYQLAKVLRALKKPDDAIKAFRRAVETYPDAESSPDAFFRIFDIEMERKNFPAAKKAMDDYLDKYPAHKNVHFAYTNIAELLFSGSLKPKNGTDGKPLSGADLSARTIADLDAGTKKLNEFVDLELDKKFQPPHGEAALIRIMDHWLKQISGYGNFALLGKEQKREWQHGVDEIIKTMDRQLRSYPAGERVGEALEKAVAVEKEKLKTQQTDLAGGETYFRKLISDYGKTPETKSKILMALAAFLQDADPKKAAAVRTEATAGMPAAVAKPATPESEDKRIVPSFQPNDWDQIIADAFEQKKLDEVTQKIERVRKEYAADTTATKRDVDDAQAIALFWEGKVLEAQNKVADAAAKFQELKDKYPRSPKLGEADYGIINGKRTTNTFKDDEERRAAIKRLSEIAGLTNTKKFDLQAKAMYLIGEIYEQMQEYDAAAETFAKISTRFASVVKVAGDGLWKAAEIAERQANGTLKVRTTAEKKAIAEKLDAEAKARRAAEKPAAVPVSAPPAGKPGDKKPDAAKPGDGKTPPKPDAKPGEKTTAATDPKK